MKPQLADDWCDDKVMFPVIGQPKIDGVRALNITGQLTGRSLKKFKNKYATSKYSHSALFGFDGEMAAGPETSPDLCRVTTSALGTIEGEPYLVWWLFDYVTHESIGLSYAHRYAMLRKQVEQLRLSNNPLWHHMRLMPSVQLNSMEDLELYDALNLAQGYEGTIIRDAGSIYKQGRSGKKPFLWRIKRFADFEFEVTQILEGQHNANEAKLNELGHTERSTHQGNMIPNGMVGAMLGTVVTACEVGGVKFEVGDEVKVGAGRMTHEQRKHYFENPQQLIGKIGKAKVFPKGMKDKLRFPTFQCLRDPVDML